jgi:hypothetical protein
MTDATTDEGALSVIGCATANPTDVGPLTGAWSGDEGGVYYIRQVGDCVWWFGTELDAFEPGATGQLGFANVAAGRIDGAFITVEWADLPLGNVVGGGGLTLVYDEEDDEIAKLRQRGTWVPFGATTFTRIQPRASTSTEPSPSD